MPAPPDAPFLAADLGGTNLRLALLHPADGTPQVRHFRQYRAAEKPALEDFIAGFLAELQHAGLAQRVDHGVIASTGLALDDGTVLAANLPWPLRIDDTRRALGFAELALVNDFHAVAHAAAGVADGDSLHICGPHQARPGPVLVLGPGTGLGVALWLPPTNGTPQVLPSEAGQIALAPGNALERQLLEKMQQTRSHVSLENALSGPGLLNLYQTLCSLRGATPVLETPAAVSTAALHGDDALAREALEVFCALLGSVAGDLALAFNAQGGIRLAGGILPQIHPFLRQSRFAERLYNKGHMRPVLERLPVRLVEHGQLGVIGAAHWYLHHFQAQA